MSEQQPIGRVHATEEEVRNRTLTREQIREIYRNRERILREQWVKVSELLIVREELSKCQETEGVNALSECAWLAKKYTDMMKSGEHRVKGWKKIDPMPKMW